MTLSLDKNLLDEESPSSQNGKNTTVTLTSGPAKEKKKRGRKPQKDHLDKARSRLELLKAEYYDKDKEISTAARTKLRNKISALQSRIKRREEGESLEGELKKLRGKLGSLVDVIGDFVSEKDHAKFIQTLKKDDKPAKSNNSELDRAISKFLEVQQS